MAVSLIGSEALASGAPSRAQLPAGTVLQVVQATTTSAASTTSASLVTTGFSASITPTSATSKILVSLCGRFYSASSPTDAVIAIYRGGSKIISAKSIYLGSSPSIAGIQSFQYLDSPATTSSTTYTLYMASNGTNTFWWLPNPGEAENNGVIILMEIAA